MLFDDIVKALKPVFVGQHLELDFLLEAFPFGHDLLVDNLEYILPIAVELLLDPNYLLIGVPNRFA